MTASENKALEEFDISAYTGVKGENFYDNDSLLQFITQVYIEDNEYTDVEQHLKEFGRMSGGELYDLIDAAHKEGKYGELVKYDRTGKRIEEIHYCEEQKQARKLCYDHGLVNLDFHKDWQHEFRYHHRWALAYMLNQNGEGGVACPLAMTEGMIRLLKEAGSDEQREKFLPIVSDPETGTHFMAGQYVTERVGGSNVSANRTTARLKDNGKYELIGEKWFCSNPGDIWATTAIIEGSSQVGLFLVPRIKDNGELNSHEYLRLKDIIGSRGKVTAEAVYNHTEAELVGKASHGLALLVRYVLDVSRIHVAIAAIGFMRRAFLEAEGYVRYRTAYGKKIIDYPSVRNTLLELKNLSLISLSLFMKNTELMQVKNSISEVMVPLLKYKTSSLSTHSVHEAIMIHGGNGILGDFSILPRLLNDSVINETWEGTHNIMQGHAMKSLARPRVQKAIGAWVKEALQYNTALSSIITNIYDLIQADFNTYAAADAFNKELLRIDILDRVWLLFGLCIMAEFASKNLADAPLASEHFINHGLALFDYMTNGTARTDLLHDTPFFDLIKT